MRSDSICAGFKTGGRARQKRSRENRAREGGKINVDREIKGSVMSTRNKQERTESARRVEIYAALVNLSTLACFRPKTRDRIRDVS